MKRNAISKFWNTQIASASYALKNPNFCHDLVLVYCKNTHVQFELEHRRFHTEMYSKKIIYIYNRFKNRWLAQYFVHPFEISSCIYACKTNGVLLDVDSSGTDKSINRMGVHRENCLTFSFTLSLLLFLKQRSQMKTYKTLLMFST